MLHLVCLVKMTHCGLKVYVQTFSWSGAVTFWSLHHKQPHGDEEGGKVPRNSKETKQTLRILLPSGKGFQSLCQNKLTTCWL